METRRAEQFLTRGLAPVGGEDARKGCGRVNMVEYYVLMYGKMRPVETVPGMGERGEWRKMEQVISTVIYCKNICKCHSVPPAQQQ
jgi:hypothetical protein